MVQPSIRQDGITISSVLDSHFFRIYIYIYIYIYWRDWLKAPYFTGEYYGVLYLPISQFHNGSDV